MSQVTDRVSTELRGGEVAAAPLRERRGTLLGAIGLAVVAAYIAGSFLSIRRNGFGYSYIHFLFDYHFGVTRRAFEGEVIRHLVAPPYSIDGFRTFGHVTFGVAAGLFVTIGVVLWRRRRCEIWWLLLAVAATSPLTFKQMIADEGRQDVFGVILLELTVLCGLFRSPIPACFLVAAASLPLALINENQLLLYIPASLAILTLKVSLSPEWPSKGWLIGAYVAAALGLCANLTFRPPTVPFPTYDAYLASKSVDALAGGTPDRWLYTGVRDNLQFAAQEWRRLGRQHVAHWADYVGMGALLLGVALQVRNGLRGAARFAARSYGYALFTIAVPYVVLCFVASDLARWLANFGTCVFLVTLFWADAFRLDVQRKYALAAIAAVQLMLHSGFGDTVPKLDLRHRATELLRYYV